jgi:hypothetical protein
MCTAIAKLLALPPECFTAEMQSRKEEQSEKRVDFVSGPFVSGNLFRVSSVQIFLVGTGLALHD